MAVVVYHEFLVTLDDLSHCGIYDLIIIYIGVSRGQMAHAWVTYVLDHYVVLTNVVLSWYLFYLHCELRLIPI